MTIRITDPIREIRDELLPLLARWVHGDAVGVEVLRTATAPVQIVADSATLVLHPDRATVLDFLQAAALLRQRHAMRCHADEVPPAIVRGWLPAARNLLRQRFPTLARVHNAVWQRCATREQVPVVRWRRAELEPFRFRPGHARPPGRPRGVDHELFLPDCRLDGATDGLGELIAAIADGSQPLQHLPELPDVPFVTVSLRLGSRVEARGGVERLLDADDIALRIARDYANCIRQTAEDLPLAAPPDDPTPQGRELDHDRLVDARIAIRLRKPAQVFTEQPEVEWTFDPERHVAHIHSDLTSVESNLADMAPSVRINASIAHAYELLGVPTEWRGSHDVLVRRHDGRLAVLHLDCLLKAADEPWAPIVWERFRRLTVFATPNGTPATCFPALHLHRSLQRLREMEQSHSGEVVRHVVLLTSPNLEALRELHDIPARFAQHMEQELTRFHDQGPTKQFYWLPAALRRATSQAAWLRRGFAQGD